MADKANDFRPEPENDELPDTRSRLVRVPRIVDSSIFGGWGIKL